MLPITPGTYSGQRKPWDSNPQAARAATCFQDRLPGTARRVVAAGWLPLIYRLRGLESNQRPPGSEPGVTTSSNYPGSSFLRDTVWSRQVRGEGIEPPLSGSKPGGLPLADPRECHDQRFASVPGVEPTSPAWKAGTFAARPRAHQGGRGGSRTLKAVTLDRFRGGCHRRLACPSVKLRWQESNLRPDG